MVAHCWREMIALARYSTMLSSVPTTELNWAGGREDLFLLIGRHRRSPGFCPLQTVLPVVVAGG